MCFQHSTTAQHLHHSLFTVTTTAALSTHQHDNPLLATPKAAEDCHADELIPTGHIRQFLDQLLVKSPGCFLYLVLAEYMVFWNIKEKRDLKLMIQLQYLSRSCIHSTLTAPTISKSTCIGEPYISKV